MDGVREKIDKIFREESRIILATLVRLLGEIDAAEEAVHDAFASALVQWPKQGIPANPRAWLISAGRFKGIDAIRRDQRFDRNKEEIAFKFAGNESGGIELTEQAVADDELRLIFTCCHPALSADARTALTLREVCGLTTEEIAHAFLTTSATVSQRIVRAKARIKEAQIPYVIPSLADLPARLETVLQVIYLVFNEGYSATAGESLVRVDLSSEALRLGRLLYKLLPDSEVAGLLALMRFQESRRAARTSPVGDIVLLDDQDRSQWDQEAIGEGREFLLRAMNSGKVGSYTIQAAIASTHSFAADSASTDWRQILSYYDLLLQAEPSPVVQLNRAVAVAMVDGPSAGLALVNEIIASGRLREYHFAYSTQGELYRRMGKFAEAILSYGRALELARQQPERRFLAARLDQIQSLVSA